MFERFTEESIRVMLLTHEEVRRLGHTHADSEQILLGLIAEGTGIAARALKAMGFSFKQGRIEVEKIIGRGPGFTSAEIPFTPRAKRILICACDEADKLESKDVGTGHLLLGLIREANESLNEEQQGAALMVLQNVGVDLTALRTEVLRMIHCM
jgi:ATP-dependent Clp protease ATP-binding subunit ClpC